MSSNPSESPETNSQEEALLSPSDISNLKKIEEDFAEKAARIIEMTEHFEQQRNALVSEAIKDVKSFMDDMIRVTISRITTEHLDEPSDNEKISQKFLRNINPLPISRYDITMEIIHHIFQKKIQEKKEKIIKGTEEITKENIGNILESFKKEFYDISMDYGELRSLIKEILKITDEQIIDSKMDISKEKTGSFLISRSEIDKAIENIQGKSKESEHLKTILPDFSNQSLFRNINSINKALYQLNPDLLENLDNLVKIIREKIKLKGLDNILEENISEETPNVIAIKKELKNAYSIEDSFKNLQTSEPIQATEVIQSVIDIAKEIRKEIQSTLSKIEKGSKEERSAIHKILKDHNLLHKELNQKESASQYSWITQPWFTDNMWKNWLRLAGILPPVSYEEVHENANYNLIDNTNPSRFVEAVEADHFLAENGKIHNYFDGKVLFIGGGGGRDETWVAQRNSTSKYRAGAKTINTKSIHMVDNSLSAIKNIRKRKKAFREINDLNAAKLLKDPEQKDMIKYLKEKKEKKEKFNTIYSLSTFHYKDDYAFGKMLDLMSECLKDGGHIAFAVKEPGTTFDGVGISLVTPEGDKYLIKDKDKKEKKKKLKVEGYLGLDGQPRFFRNIDHWKDIIKKHGFAIRQSTIDNEMNYEFDSQNSQGFFRFIIQKLNS